MSEQNLEYLKEHYDNYIYPIPIDDIEEEFIKKKKRYIFDPTYHWHRIWPELPYSSKQLNILIAGCGTNEAAVMAMCNPNHIVTGIDLSKSSIFHQKKLLDKHKIHNLKLLCDDFRKINFNHKFDLIISAGVIHHLSNPESALKYFYENLTENGAVALMVYGEKTGLMITEIKKIFNKLKLDHNKKSIDLIKVLINQLNPSHPLYLFSKKSLDFQYDSGIVDLFLHKSEKFYSIKDLINIFSRNNFNIKNFVGGNIKSFTKYFTANTEFLQNARSLNLEDQWEIAQFLNWDDRKIQVVISKNKKSDSFAYKKIDLNEIYVCRITGAEYLIDNNKIAIRLAETGEKISFNISVLDKNLLVNIFNGKEKLKSFFKLYSVDQLDNLKEIFMFLIENSYLEVSLHPVIIDRNL